MNHIRRFWTTGKPNLDEEIDQLHFKLSLLTGRASDVRTEVESFEFRPGKRRRKEVQHWLETAEIIEKEAKQVEIETTEKEVKASGMELREHIEQITAKMEELLRHGEFRNGLVLDDHKGRLLPLVTKSFVGQQFNTTLNDIYGSLLDHKVSIVGVLGMGGVGKTTLVLHIHNRLLKELIFFGYVYWVPVSRECTLYKLQTNIGEAVGVDFLGKTDEKQRAAMLWDGLRKRSKWVIFLDDMWDYFSVTDIGIPLSGNGCKIVLTTRSTEVCRKMQCESSFEVKPLSRQEAWKLFKDHLGNYEALEVESKEIAKVVAQRCGGLPLGITTLACSMRGVTDNQEWISALHKLRASCVQDEMERKVYSVLEFSYRRLNMRLRSCFLTCILYPEDWNIVREELIRLWIAEGLLDDNESWEMQFNEGQSMLNRLESLRLLEASEDSFGHRAVKMHDVIREMAIGIASSDPCFMAKSARDLTKILSTGQWPQDLRKVSFMYSDVSKIGSDISPVCPNLSTLLFRLTPVSEIPDSFFRHMKNLKVLDLSDNLHIRSLPESISGLSELRTLLLNGCYCLRNAPSLGSLVKLQDLGLSNALIDNAPKGMERLLNLQSLDLSGCKHRLVQLSQLAETLSQLQCLQLCQEVNVEDIMKLRRLKGLECWWLADNASEFNDYIRSPNFLQLSSYKIHIVPNTNYYPGCHYPLHPGQRHTVIISNCLVDQSGIWLDKNNLFFSGLSEDNIPEMAWLMLPSNIQCLRIKECWCLTGSLDSLPWLHGKRELVECEVQGCENLEHIWTWRSSSHGSGVYETVTREGCASSPTIRPDPPLQNIVGLELTDLKNFRSLVGAGFARSSLGVFSHLQRLYIYRCHQVKHLFPLTLLQQNLLAKLQKITVESCNQLEEIFSAHFSELDDFQTASSQGKEQYASAFSGNSVFSLPSLKRLHLSDLPNLKSICEAQLLCESLEVFHLEGCPILNIVPASAGRTREDRTSAGDEARLSS